MIATDSNPAGTPSSQPAFLNVAQALTMLGSEDALRNIMDMAVQRLDEEIGAIAAHLQAGDTAAASHMLHGIKGFAPIFCSDQLTEQVAHVEGLSKALSAPEVNLAYAALAPSLARLRDEMRAYLHASV